MEVSSPSLPFTFGTEPQVSTGKELGGPQSRHALCRRAKHFGTSPLPLLLRKSKPPFAVSRYLSHSTSWNSLQNVFTLDSALLIISIKIYTNIAQCTCLKRRNADVGFGFSEQFAHELQRQFGWRLCRHGDGYWALPAQQHRKTPLYINVHPK